MTRRASARRRLLAPRERASDRGADRQHDRLHALKLETALDRHRGLVVEEAVVPLLLLEDQLAAEHDRARKLLAQLLADLDDLLDGFGGDRKPVSGVPSLRAAPRDVLLEVLPGVRFEVPHFVAALEVAGVDDGHGDEDEVLVVVREQGVDAQNLVDPVAGKPVHGEDRGRQFVVQRLDGVLRDRDGRDGHEDVVEPLEVPLHALVVPPDEKADEDRRARHERRHPSALRELLVKSDTEDREAHHEAGAVDRELTLPAGLLVPVHDPVARHAELVSENVRKTLIEYMTTSIVMLPRVQSGAATPESPIRKTPFFVRSRSESCEK